MGEKNEERGATSTSGEDPLEKSPFLSEQNRLLKGFLRGQKAKMTFGTIGVLGCLFLLLGLVTLSLGPMVLESMILKSMALRPGSERLKSWLHPPVSPSLTAYAFSLTNPQEVLKGKKPKVLEVGPFVYSSTALKDTDDNMIWSSNSETLTYSPRKIYKEIREASIGDPSSIYVTVPNIPYWTAVNKLRRSSGFTRSAISDLLKLSQPFVNVSFSGLLWGYPEDLPCLSLDSPSHCTDENSPFSSNFGDDEDEDPSHSQGSHKGSIEFDKMPKRFKSSWDTLSKPSAEFVNCTCEWGLFRDRNVTMREPITFLTGVSDLKDRGRVTAFNGESNLHFWTPGSICDKVRGQDASTLPPSLSNESELEIFIPLMCRPLSLNFEKEVVVEGIRALRFIPPLNALGSHKDSNSSLRNENNDCYCPESFECLPSGAYSLEPCKRDKAPPLALSYPHFYQGDPSLLSSVEGLYPSKEKHEFFLDVVPEFGFPLRIRPRFQLNVLLNGEETNEPLISSIPKTLLPFLWAQDGFDEPSKEMVDSISFGLKAPSHYSILLSLISFVLGSLCLLSSLIYFYLRHRDADDNNFSSS